MNKFIARSLGVLMAGGLSVAIAAQPSLPKRAAVAPAKPVVVAAAPAPLPMLTKSAIKQSMNLTFAFKKPVRAGALMTKQEKKWYTTAMRTARTAEARRQIRELTYARLAQRAAERGMLILFPNSIAYAAAHEASLRVIPENGEPGEPIKTSALRLVEAAAPAPQKVRAAALKPANVATHAPQQMREAKPVRMAALRPAAAPAHPAAPHQPLPPRH